MTSAGLTVASLNQGDFGALIDGDAPFIILQPVGSVEPHGPHMTLITDTLISEGAATRAAETLRAGGIEARIAPSIPYGVTDCARGFHGAISVEEGALIRFLSSVIRGYLAAGVDHICLINNHLEPEQDRAIRAAAAQFDSTHASVASPLERRWAKTLSPEFKSGACHAGRYETSIVLALAPDFVDEDIRQGLQEVDISLSKQLAAGVTTFAEMGMTQAYAGAPAAASSREGSDLLELLAEMVATTVREAIAA